METSTQCVIIGAGFAGASTAWALARAGVGPGLILEREFTFGVHASGRNAGLVRLAEEDPLIRTLACRSLERLRTFEHGGAPVLTATGGLTLASRDASAGVAERHDALRDSGVDASLLTFAQAVQRFPLLSAFAFDLALWCPSEGTVDIHALLSLYLEEARRSGFTLRTRCPVEDLLIEGGRVTGVHTPGQTIRAEIVVDASGAWAGRLGQRQPLPLRPFRRHLCATGSAAGWHARAPYVWMWDNELYCRPESEGLLMSPCDATPCAPDALACDPDVGSLLAARLEKHAPGLLEVPLRRTWACLRTFTPDGRPLIGADHATAGLYHVSGLGGFGMMTSAAIGEAAEAAITGRALDWLDAASLSSLRPAVSPAASASS